MTKPKKALFGLSIIQVAALLCACSQVPSRTDEDLRRLQGHWQGEGPGGACSIIITGHSLHFHARPDFWFETTFTLPSDTDPTQLHATIIKDSSPQQVDVGTVVVAVFKVNEETLKLAVIEDFDGPPQNPVITESDWAKIEANWMLDRYRLKRVQAETKIQPE